MNPPATTASELVTRALLRQGDGDLFVVSSAKQAQSRLLQELIDEFTQLSEPPVVVEAGADARRLVRELARTRQNRTIIKGLDRFGRNDWQALDSMRSMLSREAPVIAVVDAETLEMMAAVAPNLFSWAGAAVYQVPTVIEAITEAERERRLAALRSATGLTDAEVIRRAEEGTLSTEPEFAEWLALLGREPLLDG